MEWSEFQLYIGHLSKRDQARVQEAFDLGAFLHKDQKRKSGEPYYTHPVTTALRLAFVGADADTLIAALLHDSVEDTPVTLAEIDKQFDGDVAKLIDGVTKLEDADVADSPTLNVQVETVRKIFTLMREDIRIMVIKLFDRLHNMETAGYLPPEKQIALATETMDLYVKIAQRLSMQDLQHELERMCLKILEPELYERMQTLRQENIESSKRILQKIKRKLHLAHPDIDKRVNMVFEFKSWRRLREQIASGGSAVTGLPDLTVVFVCKDRDTCYRVLGFLHEPWQQESMSFHDYINTPMINGYQGINTTIILEDGTRVRCKIRTEEMHEYAKKGAALYVFDPEQRKEFTKLVSWTKHIEPLTENTKDRSDEFWQSLQSDILGDLMLVHGPGDLTATIPRNSTALDAAFYLFDTRTFSLTSLKVNGQDVPLSTPLTVGASLDPTFGEEGAPHYEWLTMVRTGFATAKIRAALAHADEEERVITGRKLVQDVMLEKRKGYLEEFDEEKLQGHVKALGYDSLQDAFVAVAEGRLLATRLYASLFEKEPTNGSLRKTFDVRYTVPLDNMIARDRLRAIRQKFAQERRNMHSRASSKLNSERIVAAYTLTNDQRKEMLADLEASGATNVRMESRRSRILRLSVLGLLFLLWGLDPVFAKVFLLLNVSPLFFAETRAWSIVAFAFLLFTFTSRSHTLSRIPLRYPSLWLAGVCFFLVGLFSYLALDEGSPVLYNTVLRSNSFLLAIPVLLHNKYFGRLLIAVALTFAGYALIVTGSSSTGFLYTLLVLAFFAMYTVASARFQQEAKVGARYPQFFFFTSIIAALCAVPLAFLFKPEIPPAWLLLALIAYCVCFIGVPYIIFYAVTRLVGYGHVSPWISVSLLITFVGQWFVMGIDSLWLMAPAAVLLVVASFLSSATLMRHPLKEG